MEKIRNVQFVDKDVDQLPAVGSDEDTQVVVVSVKRYAELIDAEAWKHALEAGGVDNWEGYYESLEYFGED